MPLFSFFSFMNVREYYQKALDEKGFQADAAQQAAVDRLQTLYNDWQSYQKIRARPLRNFFRRPEPPRGVYFWGGVGRGKSFLMDAFYLTVPITRKVRLHFHEFMREVHQQMRSLKGEQDPLDEVARRLARRYQLICFDEFHVSDVADAMILHKLLFKLFEHGTSFVMTSNYAPDALYPDGLHRDRLLPAIALIKDKLDIMAVDSGIDYRRRSLEQLPLYLQPLSAETEGQLKTIFERMAEALPVPESEISFQNHVADRNTYQLKPVIQIQNRELPAVAIHRGVGWFSFAELCGQPRSQNDYLELADQFSGVIVAGIPKMSAEQASEARRFTWLIDVLYDHRVKVAFSAAVDAEVLYTAGLMANEFHRTVSRIHEMLTRDYLESEHRAALVL